MKNPTNSTSFCLRFGIIGTNTITDKVIEGARHDSRFVLAAVYSRTAERAAAFAQKHNIEHTFTSLADMAASPHIDAVYIASPNALHASQTILFLNHGKHVLCEKPLASNLREAREMVAAARLNNRVLMEAMKPTLTPNFGALRNNMHRLGTIRRYFSCYCQYSSRYDRLKAGEVLNAFKPELSNGAIVDIGIYTIYPMVVLFGRPRRIEAMGMKLFTGVDGQGAVNFEYDGMTATILYSKIADSALPTEIQGEEGTLTADRINIIKQVTLRTPDGNTHDLTLPGTIHEYYYEVAEFISLVQHGQAESEINSHEHSLITMEIIDEIRRQLGVVFPAD